MGRATANALAPDRPAWAAYVELTKPITWFPPMWAFGCGLVSVSSSGFDRWPFAVGAILLAGPLLCGTSQIVNDWFDRHVDAINEPDRPIPSGRVPGRNGLWFAIAWSLVSMGVAALLGTWVFLAALLGLALAWAYSAPPFRLKKNGWYGNAAVGLCYEGLPWFTAAAAVTGAFPSSAVVIVALLYSLGAHGIMTLNDFKAMTGDRQMGVRSLPVQLGADRAAQVACALMLLPQLAVIGLLLASNSRLAAATVTALVVAQSALMLRFLRDPVQRATWFSGFGVLLYVLGMLVTAVALRGAGA
jgi:chlorophyll/bacteriochlorophyll a synthase